MFSLDADAQNEGRVRARHKRLNLTLFGSHIAVVAVILGVIAVSYKAPVEASSLQTSRNVSILDQDSAPSVDQIAAADVATSVAQIAELSVVPNVESLSYSLATKAELAQSSNDFINKPQIVEADSGRPAISQYVTVSGDSVQTVAAKFGISEDSVRWANNLTIDALAPNRTLFIVGTTGIIYTVKSGDDLARIAEKYGADKDRVITYNNLELSGLVTGEKIVIPDGVLPANERPGYRAPARSSVISAGSYRTVYSGNGYAYGYCTWYAYNRRAELGRPIGSNWHNASNWARAAAGSGFRVDKSPEPGAIFQTSAGWSGAGHVGIVEKVNADGSIEVSEMNYAGWNVISGGPHAQRPGRTISASQVSQFNYIH